MIALPDVNVLIAIGWEPHVHHAAAVAWFQTVVTQGWATCQFTQSAFLRLSLNPKVVNTTINCQLARQLLIELLALPGHQYVADTPSITAREFDLIESKVTGYRQISDASLIHLVRVHGMKLATFDQSISAICPWPENLEVISTGY